MNYLKKRGSKFKDFIFINGNVKQSQNEGFNKQKQSFANVLPNSYCKNFGKFLRKHLAGFFYRTAPVAASE